MPREEVELAAAVEAALPLQDALEKLGVHVRVQSAITVAEAEALARTREAALLRCLDSIAALTLVDGIDLAALYDSNLVSAMINALQPPG